MGVRNLIYYVVSLVPMLPGLHTANDQKRIQNWTVGRPGNYQLYGSDSKPVLQVSIECHGLSSSSLDCDSSLMPGCPRRMDDWA